MNNSTVEVPTDRERQTTSEASLWFCTVHAILAILNILTNGSVIGIILARKCLHTAPNWFILSLAVADILMAVVVFPAKLICTFSSCSKAMFSELKTTFIFISMVNLMCVALDRYFAVVRPLKYQRFAASKKVFLCIGLSWFCSITFSILSFYLASVLNSDAFKIFRSSLAVSLVAFLNLCLGTTYCKMLYVVKRQKRQIALQVEQLRYNYNTGVSIQFSSNERLTGSSALKLVGALIVLFVCCSCVDFYCYYIMTNRVQSPNMHVISAATLMFSLNSFLNGLVYALAKPDVRRELRKLYNERRVVE